MVRAGEILEMSTKELLVGDVVLLEAGDKIPADGVLTQGDDVTVNESSLTGEAEDVRKSTEQGEDVFLLSGCTLTSGRATMMAIAVGAESRWGRIKVRWMSGIWYDVSGFAAVEWDGDRVIDRGQPDSPFNSSQLGLGHLHSSS